METLFPPLEIAPFRRQEKYLREDVISAVDECMKKHVDNLLQFLEGFSGRLSQLESHFCKFERSVADLQHDEVHNQSEKDVQLKSLEKLERSIGVIWDKNEEDVQLVSLEKLERPIGDLSDMIHDNREKDAQLRSLEKLETIGELQHNIIEEKSEKAMQFKSLEKMEMLMGDLRSDMILDKNIKDRQFVSLKEHLQEVGRSVQILRDKQEIAETQKELAKLQFFQKESTSENSKNCFAPSVAELKRHGEAPDMSNQCLTIISNQASTPVAIESNQSSNEPAMQQPIPASVNMRQDQNVLNQIGSFYPVCSPTPSPQEQQSQPLENQILYVQSSQHQQPFSQFQQQRHQPSPKQFPQQTMLPQQPIEVPHIRPETPAYPQDQSTIRVPETYPGSLPRRIGAEYLDHYPLSISVSLSTIPQHRGNCAEGIPFGYGGPGSTASLPPSQYTIQCLPCHQDGQTSGKSGYITKQCPPQPRVQAYSRMCNHMNVGSSDPTQNFQQGSCSSSHLPANQIQHIPPSAVGLNCTVNNPNYEMTGKSVGLSKGSCCPCDTSDGGERPAS